MALGRRRSIDPEDVRRAAENARAIEEGGLPLSTRRRLANLRSVEGSYTSDLSTSEFLLLRQAGFRPVSQVMGSCFYQTGFQYMPGMRRPTEYAPEGLSTPRSIYSGGFEYDSFGRRVYRNATFGQLFDLDTETEAWQEARRRALSRLSEEAKLAGAHAVVGVHLQRGSNHDWGRNLTEFLAVGTAVTSNRFDLGDEPVLSNLSGQDFAALYASGYWPVGLVVGVSVIYVMTGAGQRLASGRFAPNSELKDYTQGVQHARKVAISRVSLEAAAFDAHGVVGLSLDVSRREHEHEHEGSWSRKQKDMIVTVHALGTAIVQIERTIEAPTVQLALSLKE